MNQDLVTIPAVLQKQGSPQVKIVSVLLYVLHVVRPVSANFRAEEDSGPDKTAEVCPPSEAVSEAGCDTQHS